MAIISSFPAEEASGLHEGLATGFFGVNTSDAFTFLDNFDSGTDIGDSEVAFENIGVTSVIKFINTSSQNVNKIQVNQSDGWISSDGKFTCSFWICPSAPGDGVNEVGAWGFNSTWRTILGTRPATPSDTANTKGWSFAVKNNSATVCGIRLNINGQVIDDTIERGKWTSIIITIDSAQTRASLCVGMTVAIGALDVSGKFTTLNHANIAGLASDLNDLYIGVDNYTTVPGGGNFYFTGSLSNLKFYKSAPSDMSVAGTVESFLENITAGMWKVYRPSEVAGLGALTFPLIANYSLELPESASAVTPVLRDRNFGRRSTVASGFGSQQIIFNNELPPSFTGAAGAGSIIFGEGVLKQRLYTPSATNIKPAGGVNHQFVDDFLIEFWFKCTQLPGTSETQYLASKVRPRALSDNGIKEGFSVALVEDGLGNVHVVYYNDLGAADAGTHITVTSAEVILVDTWYHVAVNVLPRTLAPLVTVNMYISEGAVPSITPTTGSFNPGVLDGIGVPTSDDFKSYPLMIGGRPVEDAPSLSTKKFIGYMTEFRMWGKAKDPAQIAAFRYKALPI